MASNSSVGFAQVNCPECARVVPVFPLPNSNVTCPCGSEWRIAVVTPDDAMPRLETIQTERSVERGETYAIIDALYDRDGTKYATPARYIMCLRADCEAMGRPSYSAHDIAHRYCGGCHRYHTLSPNAHAT
jgi:hypothetical protein